MNSVLPHIYGNIPLSVDKSIITPIIKHDLSSMTLLACMCMSHMLIYHHGLQLSRNLRNSPRFVAIVQSTRRAAVLLVPDEGQALVVATWATSLVAKSADCGFLIHCGTGL